MILWIDIFAFVAVAAVLAGYLEFRARQDRRNRERAREEELWDQMFWNGRKSDAGVGERKIP